MKRIGAKLSLFILFALNTKAYGQHNNKQIDSILNVADKTENVQQAIQLGIKASEYARKINYEDGIVGGFIVAALKCYNAGRNEDVLKFTSQAENTVTQIKSMSFRAHLMTLKGMSYTNLGFYEVGKRVLNAALPVASDIPDPDTRYSRMGNIYAALSENNEKAKGKLSISLAFVKKSYQEFIKVNKKSRFAVGLALATNNVGTGFLEIKKYDSAEVYLNKAILLAAQYKDLTVKSFANSDLGEVYYRQKKYTQSKHCYYKAAAAARALGNGYDLKDIYVGLSRVYTALKDEKNARELLELSVKLADSLNKADKAAVNIPLNDIIKANDKETSENIIELVTMLTGVLALFIVAVSGLILVSGRYKRQLKITNEKIEELSKDATANINKNSIECLKEIVELAKDNNPLFLAKFNELFPEFNLKLLAIAPNLIVSEIEVCILLRINFDTKEIARYTNSTVRSVEGKKRRIRKKLNIPPIADTNIWIANV
ncbi:tetratricopeptide repeat protein [Mucilaginibacter dorajii]|uniref:HTH luxR-type domain-containing protein n=1 Tax=Mucilaginibacter dorajii TaxID=692994 RepID=A0ABP7P4Q9_9SPHI|nr:tetratricopeptide repeat protein [Mucilaginibacter dorajii]MCS3734449.1 tetratricopeptide (TPR) repeat protein [Mucilaginibacter dorajii]